MAPSRNRRPGFSRRAQYGLFLGYVLAIAGAIVGAALLVLSTLNPPAFGALRAAARELTAPVSSGLGAVWRGLIAAPTAASDYVGVAGENRRLRAALSAQAEVLMRARTLNRENQRLRALLRLRDVTADPVVVARLVSSSASSTRRFAVLNAGSRQGVRSGQPVRGPDGLIGRVLETGPNTARVLLAIDPESVVPVRRTRDGLPGIATGRGDGQVEIRSVALANAPFQPGDVLVTSGVGGIYAPGVPVARVLARSGDGAVARVFAHPDTLDFALVDRVFLSVAAPPAEAAR